MDYNDEDAVWLAILAQQDQQQACAAEIAASAASIDSRSDYIDNGLDYLEMLIDNQSRDALLNTKHNV